MTLNDNTKHAIAVIKQREKIKTHLASFKEKVGDAWKAVRDAYGDDKVLTANSPEVVIVNAWPDRVKVHVLTDFTDWLSSNALDLMANFELSENDKTIDLRLCTEANRCSQTVLIQIYDAYTGIKIEHSFTFDELAGMLALGYDFHPNNTTFFIK